MGTRSTIRFYSEWESKKEPLVVIYQQYDGYINGVGHELAEFLKDFTVINGIGSGQDIIGKFANGMGCLAAQFIAKFKDCVGGLYITNANNTEDYNYEVRLVNGELQISVNSFIGTPEELLSYDESEVEE